MSKANFFSAAKWHSMRFSHEALVFYLGDANFNITAVVSWNTVAVQYNESGQALTMPGTISGSTLYNGPINAVLQANSQYRQDVAGCLFKAVDQGGGLYTVSITDYETTEILGYFMLNADGQWVEYAPYGTATFTPGSLLTAADAVDERYSYTPHGKQTVHDEDWSVREDSAVENNIGFGGYVEDRATGLCYARNRFYHVTLGIDALPLGTRAG